MKSEFYRCPICGNIVYLVEGNAEHLSCCGKKMEKLVAGSVEAAREKHIPDVKKEDGKVIVQVGEVIHPMIKEHHIGWIAAVSEDSVEFKYLKPEEEPKAVFCNKDGRIKAVYAWCNLHGLWVKEI
ncbi:MAG: desulfoferrodoxin [Spirochaetales bacterium]|nr:desulfoferrodoxin [Spirochaetales bacterium]MBQ2259470.1 desulfoferrodoxin [Spirochaetales bacterium]